MAGKFQLAKNAKEFEEMFGSGFVDVHALVRNAGFRSTGSLKIDSLLRGGFPKGTMVELWGPPQCLAGDTYIDFETRGADGRRRGRKGGTIQRLYERFHGLPHKEGGKGKYARPVDDDTYFYALSMDDEGRIRRNRIVDVVYSGQKECFRVETEGGFSIVATADHKFWTGTKFVRLGDLQPGGTVFVHNKTRLRKTEEEKEQQKWRNSCLRADVYVKHHPVAGIKVVENGKYLYRRLRRSRAVVEARMNGLAFDEYIERLNSGDLDGLVFLSRDQHVHHLDEDITNDDPENLVVLSDEEHRRLHTTARQSELRYVAVPDTVKSIEPVGVRDTYDLVMAEPYRNFVAEGFVVHNSGKSTVAVACVASTLRQGGRACYVDLERGLDLFGEVDYVTAALQQTNEDLVAARAKRQSWLWKNGIDILDPNFRLYDPANGEELFHFLANVIHLDMFDVVVVDSVAAILTAKQLEGNAGESHYGAVAKLLSAEMPRLLRLYKGNQNTNIIFINQVRDKIGFMQQGQKSTGGHALEHYVGTKIRFRLIGREPQANGDVITTSRVKVDKSRYASPKEVDIQISGEHGLDVMGELLDFADQQGYVYKNGNWHYFFDQPINPDAFKEAQKKKAIEDVPGFAGKTQGRESAKKWMEENGWYDKLYDEAVRVGIKD